MDGTDNSTDDLAELRAWLRVPDGQAHGPSIIAQTRHAAAIVQVLDDASYRQLVTGLTLTELPHWSQRVLAWRAKRVASGA